MSNNVINRSFDGDFSILIKHGDEIIEPVVENGVKWETDRQGSPGKLTFKVYKDRSGDWEFQEGDPITLRFRSGTGDWSPVFYGYVFKKKRGKDGWIDVTAYDQLRYFKNKQTEVYKDQKASDVVKRLANEHHLTLGTIDDTNYVIGERVEDDQTIFDIVQNALDLTLTSTSPRSMYILYDDAGKLCLRNANNMKLDVVINETTAENFDYTSSIDDETYTEVELYYDNDKSNKREYYRALDKVNTGTWGRLRLTESINTPLNAEDRVKQMLNLYNRKTRELKVTGAFGDCRCRAGASVVVQLELGDVKVDNYMLIEKATHTFKKNEYRMDLTLVGFKEDEVTSDVIYDTANVTKQVKVTVSTVVGDKTKAGKIDVMYRDHTGKGITLYGKQESFEISVLPNSKVTFRVTPPERGGYSISINSGLKYAPSVSSITVTDDVEVKIGWYMSE